MSLLIECESLSKSYGHKQALKNVSFTCQAGDPIALVGPNGAGKTTLFSILCHYFKPSSGTVRIMGHAPGSQALFSQVSALPQDAMFDPDFSILRQLMFYGQLKGFTKKQARQEALRVLELMELSDSACAYATALSHGMRKRASIAQALMGSPKLVLLDEPTAGLDPANAKNVRQQISKLSGETTFLISSHNIQELEQLCDTVLHLDKGQLKKTIQKKNNAYQNNQESYLTIQLEDADKKLALRVLSGMNGVKEVMSEQKNEFVICYDAQTAPDLDQQLLRCLANQSWQYRRLIKGQTLEEQLFSKTS